MYSITLEYISLQKKGPDYVAQKIRYGAMTRPPPHGAGWVDFALVPDKRFQCRAEYN